MRASIVFSVLLFQQTLGGLAFPVSKYGLIQIEPFTFAFYRFILASSVLLTLNWLRMRRKRKKVKVRPIEKSDYLKIFGLGVLIIPFNQVAYLFGQSLTTASHGALLFATSPIWLFLAGLLLLNEKFVLRRVVGVILGIAGVVIILRGGAVELDGRHLLGDLIILGAVLAWVFYTVLGKPLVLKYGAFRVTAYVLSCGSALYFPFGLYRALHFDYSSVPPLTWLCVLYMALAVSVISYVLWYWLLKHMETTRMAVFNNLQPVIASAVALVFLNEPFTLSLAIGGLVVITGVLITEKRRSATATDTPRAKGK